MTTGNRTTEQRISIFPNYSSIIILFVGTFLLRMFIAISVNMPIIDDDADYHAIGIALSEGKGFILDNQPTAFRPPGYPTFIGFCYWIFGPSPLAVHCVQAFLDTLTCLFLFLIACKIFNSRTAFIATCIFAIFPLHILYIPRISAEIFFTLFFLSSIWLMIRPWEESQNLMRIIIVGLMWGITTLIRPMASVFIIIAVWYFWDRAISIKVNTLRATILIIVFGLVLLPWMVRNQIRFERFTLTSNFGLNLWIGNHPGANGGNAYPRSDNPLAQEQDKFKQSDLGLKLAFDYFKHNIQAYPWLLSKKLAHFFSSDYHAMSVLQYRPEWKTYKSSVLVYRELSLTLWILFHLPYVAVMILGIIGIICQASTRTRSIRLLISIILIFIFIHLVFYGDARYRVPIIPIFILFAANGFYEWRIKTLRVNGLRRVVALALIALMISIWVAEYVVLQM
jgi:4-amino-4-deoxy-L-arabinose transferase-like glycosyltransferase